MGQDMWLDSRRFDIPANNSRGVKEFRLRDIAGSCTTCQLLTFSVTDVYSGDSCDISIKLKNMNSVPTIQYIEEVGVQYYPEFANKKLLKSLFSQKFYDLNQNFIICFGEKIKTNFQHDGQIVIHVTPFDIWGKNNTIIKTLDKAYVDHFLISWDLFNKIIVYEERKKIFESILRLRNETIEKQIDWKKINEWVFEIIARELLEKEKIFSKIVPGGKGPDQGKDGFGYYTMKMPSGKDIPVKTLIQCKYTLNTKSFSFSDIQGYVSRAKHHNCNYLLFITNGELSGDAISTIESGAFKEKDFYDVDFYDATKLMDLLEKFDDVRIKYFFTPLVNNENT